jgi:hypothetical protein
MSDLPQDESASLAMPAARVLETLEQGDIIEEYGLLRWSSNYAFLLSVCHDDLTVTAVYKPQRGERPLWDFPDGTLCYRERASYLASAFLSWDIVPPTALREGKRGLGSMQFYIDHDPSINYFSFDEAMHDQLRRIAAFDYLVNNADRKGGHCLLDSKGHIWGIDHGITFHSAHKLRTVIWDFAGQPIGDGLLADVERLRAALEMPDSQFRESLCGLLTTGEINAFLNRARHLLKLKRYPTPGAGPNYPWPPV